jgi:hypothetical protein
MPKVSVASTDLTGADLRALLRDLGIIISAEEADRLANMTVGDLRDFLKLEGLLIPASLALAAADALPQDVLTERDLLSIVAPLQHRSDEPPLTDASARPGFEVFMSSVREAFGDRLGVIRAQGSTVTIPVRAASRVDVEIVARLKGAEGVEAVVTALDGPTMSELLLLKEAVVRVLERSEAKNWGVGILVDSGKLHISIPEWDDTLARLVEDAVSSALKTISDLSDKSFSDVASLVYGTNQETDIRDASPQGGGKWIKPAGMCTTAFVVQNSAGDKRALSAGHCVGVGNTWADVYDGNLDGTTDWQYYGNVLTNAYANNQPDAMTWPIADWDGNARVYMVPNGWKTVAGVLHEVDQAGVNVCGTGWGIKSVDAADYKCNYVGIINYDFYANGVNTPDTNCFERQVRDGDSGGPVYGLNSGDQALAAGVTKGDHSYWDITWKHYWCFTTIDDALAGVGGLTLVVSGK